MTAAKSHATLKQTVQHDDISAEKFIQQPQIVRLDVEAEFRSLNFQDQKIRAVR